MQTRVWIREPDFGWAWLGVGALALVGGLAVFNGRRHLEEAQQQGKGSRAHHPWRPMARSTGRWRVDNGILDLELGGALRSIAASAVPGLPQALAYHDLAEADHRIGAWLAREAA